MIRLNLIILTCYFVNRDLLCTASSERLEVKMNPEGGLYVPGLTYTHVQNLEQINEVGLGDCSCVSRGGCMYVPGLTYTHVQNLEQINALKGSGSYLRPKTHIQHTHPQHLSTSTQTSTNHTSTHCNRMG